MDDIFRENKIRTIPVRIEEGFTDEEIMRELVIPRRTYYRWKARIKKEGIEFVVKKRKTGSGGIFSECLFCEERILHLRKRYGWGPTKLEKYLELHDGTHVPHNQIYNFLFETGLNKPLRTKRKTRRSKNPREEPMTLS